MNPNQLKLCSDNWDLLNALFEAKAHLIKTGSFTVHVDANGKPSKVNLNFDGWRK